MALLATITILLYTLAGYPLLMLTLARLRPKPTRSRPFDGRLTVLLCARNEGECIRARLENLLAMDYPAQLLDIVVVSDGSTDATDKVVGDFAQRKVRLVRIDPPQGKAAALNAGMDVTAGDFILLCDARQHFRPDVARRLMSHFADESVGAVSGRLAIMPANETAAASGVGSYWSYEVALRKAEAASGSVVGATGAIYAVRREFCAPLPPGTILDDVLIPMRVVLAGRRVTYDAEAVAVDAKPVYNAGELARKVRTLYGNLQLLRLAPELFSPWRNPIWFRFVSHKLLRLLLPVMLAGCLVFSLFGEGWLIALGLVQAAFWTTAALAWRLGWRRFPWNAMAGFLLLNVAVVRAWAHWFAGRADLWTRASSHDAAPCDKGTRP